VGVVPWGWCRGGGAVGKVSIQADAAQPGNAAKPEEHKHTCGGGESVSCAEQGFISALGYVGQSYAVPAPGCCAQGLPAGLQSPG
jgi:hypothetical protein